MKHILFLCSQNRLRSPTAERVFSAYPDVEVKSAGLDNLAVTVVNEELIDWAHTIVVMESAHKKQLKRKFGTCLGTRPVLVLGIPDEYEYMQPELISRLHAKESLFID